ncbi:MAG: tRNA preQ1(34) S-adenosylmethionine ribosyltransferase-isomerase QueA [Actinomycetota bacterium]
MDIKQFDYQLPPEYIAQKPVYPRDKARLMVLNRREGHIRHDFFYNLGLYLRVGDCLVINESRVLRCRLMGKKTGTGANIECFVLEKIKGNTYLVLLKPSKRLKPGSRVEVGEYMFEVKSKKNYGKAEVEFDREPKDIFEKYGMVPLPPYIKSRGIEEEDYQTVYAARDGSAAAPTAGLHFTDRLIGDLESMGIIFARVTLNIGMDTFRPIKEDEIEKHKMHSEYYQLQEEEAEKIREAKSRGGRIVAVGTTSTRVLETVAEKYGDIKADKGKTSLYIYPGYTFKATGAMITNFHLPRSTLLVMVSAFAGRENLLSAYNLAREKNYRFYSFGDCMLII